MSKSDKVPLAPIFVNVRSDGCNITGEVIVSWNDPSLYAAMKDAIGEHKSESEKLRNKLAALVIALKDDITMEQAVSFYKEFYDVEHGDCPHGNYSACPKCRCDTAHDLIANILDCIDEEGYEIVKKREQNDWLF